MFILQFFLFNTNLFVFFHSILFIFSCFALQNKIKNIYDYHYDDDNMNYDYVDDDVDDDDLGSAKRLGYVDDDEEEGEGSEVDGRKNPMPKTTPSGHDVSRGISTGSGKPFPYYRKKSNL